MALRKIKTPATLATGPQDVDSLFQDALAGLADAGDMSSDLAKLASSIRAISADTWLVQFPPQYRYQKTACERADRKQRLEAAVSVAAKRPINLAFAVTDEESPASETPNHTIKNLTSFSVSGEVASATQTHDEAAATPEETLALLQEYDRLAAFWNEAEEQLAAMRTPVACEFQYSSGNDLIDDQSVDFCEALGWVRYNKGWRLCHGVYRPALDEDYAWRPIAERPVDVKIDAVGAYDGLRHALKKETSKYLARVRKAADTLATLLGKK